MLLLVVFSNFSALERKMCLFVLFALFILFLLFLLTAFLYYSLYNDKYESNAWWFWLTSDDEYESNHWWFWLTSDFLSGFSAFIFRLNRCYCKNTCCLHKSSQVILSMTWVCPIIHTYIMSPCIHIV